MTTYTRRAREGAHLISESNFTRSRESGVAAPSAQALIGPGVLVMDSLAGLVPFDGTGAVEGVAYGYADDQGAFGYTARDAEVKDGYLAYRTSTPTVVSGAAPATDATAGNLSVNGVVIAVAANEALATLAAAITGAVPGVVATVDGSNVLHLKAAAGGDIVVGGDVAVLAELALSAGTTHGASVASLRRADIAALKGLGIIVR